MSILNVEKITPDYGGRIILKDATFRLLNGEHIGLIGSNGEGKSTLIDVIIGRKLPDGGTVSWAKNITIGYLDQYTSLTSGKTIFEVLQEAFSDLYEAEKKLNEIYTQMAFAEGDELDKLIEESGELQNKLDEADFYNLDITIRDAANGLGLDEIGLDRDVTNLSGGQRSKVLLTKLLLTKPDILVLDEPTNFLDEAQIGWLTNFLKNYENAFILVSHDTTFLNNTVNVILHLEWGTLTRYKGDYNNFLSVYEIEKRNLEQAYLRQQREIAKLEEFIAKNKARAATANMARSRQKTLDKMDVITLQKEKIKPSFGFNEDRTPGRVVFKGENVVLGYDEPLTKPMNFEFVRNKKIALKGVNGIGKTTFLSTILGVIPPISGKVERDPFITCGYFVQEDYGNDKSAINDVWDVYPHMLQAEVRQLLARCGLTNEQMTTLTKVLSGGEKAKVRLAKLMVDSYNVLILDEPTNHLDILAKDSLKEAIKNFKGTVVLVSHDYDFYCDIVDEVINVEDFTLKIL